MRIRSVDGHLGSQGLLGRHHGITKDILYEYNLCVHTQNLFALQQLTPSQRQFKSALAVMVLLGAGWVFGFLLIIEEVNTAPLRWLFIIVNCSQVKGIVIFRLNKSQTPDV